MSLLLLFKHLGPNSTAITVGVSAVLQETRTKSLTVGATLQKAVTTTVATSAAIRGRATKTFTVSSIISLTISKTVTVSSDLRRLDIVKEITGSGVAQKQSITASITVGSCTQKIVTKTVTISGCMFFIGQQIRPEEDVYTNDWTPINADSVAESINELIPDDTTFARSGGTITTVRTTLTNIDEPNSGSIVLFVRLRKREV